MRLFESFKERIFGPLREQLVTELRAAESNGELVQERLAELELALEDVNWLRLVNEGNREMSRDGLKKIMAISQMFFLKNPLINRAVLVQSYYVWAQGVTIQAQDPAVNEVVQEFMDARKNKVELTSHQARTLKEQDLAVLGNLFLVLFPSRADGQVLVRSIFPEQVEDIISNPEDVKEPWFYRRVWIEQRLQQNGTMASAPRVAYYPDWNYQPAAKPRTIGSTPVMWESPVMHIRVGGLSHMRFGIPETYASLDWAKSHKEFMEDWATVVRSLSRFAWNMTTKGGGKAVAAAKAKLATTMANGTLAGDRNPPAVTGSTFIATEGVKMEPIRTSGATVSAEDSRQLKLMAATGMGLPETFFGDVSVGTLATARSLDRPTELKFRDRQTLWADILMDIFQFVIDCKIRAGRLAQAVDRTISITFPPILEHEILATVQAIVAAATLSGSPEAGTVDREELSRMLLTALGRQDVDEAIEQMRKSGAFDRPAPAQGEKPQPTAEAQMNEALRKLNARLEEIAA